MESSSSLSDKPGYNSAGWLTPEATPKMEAGRLHHTDFCLL